MEQVCELLMEHSYGIVGKESVMRLHFKTGFETQKPEEGESYFGAPVQSSTIAINITGNLLCIGSQ